MTDLTGELSSLPPMIQPDGKIVTCATVNTGGSSGTDLLISRWTKDGAPDPTFSIDGHTTVDFDHGAGYDFCTALALQSNGMIVAVGQSKDSTGTYFAVARLDAFGAPDTAGFGSGTGKVKVGVSIDTVTPYIYNEAWGVALQADGKIVVAGSADSSTNGRNFAAARLNIDGSLDTSFNASGQSPGFVVLDFDPSAGNAESDAAQNVAIDAAGNIVLAGSTNQAGNDDFAIARFLPDGTPDATFHSNGRTSLAFDIGGGGASNNDNVYAVHVQADGMVLLAGTVDSGAGATNNLDIGIARLRGDGSPDVTFGSGGRVVVPFDQVPDGVDLGISLARQSNGKILVAGAAQANRAGPAPLDAMVFRLNADGSLDSQFGVGGKNTYNFNLAAPGTQLFTGIALQGSQIIAAGLAAVPAGSSVGLDGILVRLQNDSIFADTF